MTDKEFIYAIQETLFKADMIAATARPYIIICNPINKSQLVEVVGDKCIVKAMDIIEQNKYCIVTRAEWEGLVE